MKCLSFLLPLAVSCWSWGLGAQDPGLPPDQWPMLRPCQHAPDPAACTDSLLQRALQDGLQDASTGGGLTVVAFTIDAEGVLAEVQIIRGKEEAREAIREALALLPGWVPGYRDGTPVSVTLRLPLRIIDPEGSEEQYAIFWGVDEARSLTRDQLRRLSAQTVLIRDPEGSLQEPAQVTWTCRRGDKVRRHRGPARDDSRRASWLRRCPRGAILEIEARIARETVFLPVNRRWTLQ